MLHRRRPSEPHLYPDTFNECYLSSWYMQPVWIRSNRSPENFGKIYQRPRPRFVPLVLTRPLSYIPQFKVEVHLRNHASLDRDVILKTVVDSIDKSPGHTIDLKNPDVVAYVMVFKVRVTSSSGLQTETRAERQHDGPVARLRALFQVQSPPDCGQGAKWKR